MRILVNYPGFTISFAFVLLFLTCFTGVWYGYLPSFENPDKVRGLLVSSNVIAGHFYVHLRVFYHVAPR